jgi:phage terminase large subunit
MMATITLPHKFTLRPYQKPLWNYFEAGGKRVIAAWHRRAGKDEVCMHWTAVAAHQRVGTSGHCCRKQPKPERQFGMRLTPSQGSAALTPRSRRPSARVRTKGK